MKIFSFPKNEKLCSKKNIDDLFSNGQSLFSYPIRVVYSLSEAEGNSNIQALFVVSRKKFKRAVARNLIRRRMRESFRLNKNELIEKCKSKGKHINIAFLYTSTKAEDYKIILKAMQNLLSTVSLNIIQ